MTPEERPEVEEALRRVSAAALVVGQVTAVLHARVGHAIELGADPVEVLRAAGLRRLPAVETSADEMARRRRRGRGASD